MQLTVKKYYKAPIPLCVILPAIILKKLKIQGGDEDRKRFEV
jgi:hypothetical protein